MADPPLPEPIKTLIKRAFEVDDTKADDCGQRLVQEIFSPNSKMVINKRAFTWPDGTYW